MRTHAFSDREAPFIRQTVLGLRGYVNNLVLAPSVDGEVPADVAVELVPVRVLSDPARCLALATFLRQKYPAIALVMGHMGNGTRMAKPLAELLEVPLIGSFGGSDVNVELSGEKHQAVYREVLAVPSATFLAIADYLRAKLIDFGAEPQRLATWHRGVQLDSFFAPAAPGDADAARGGTTPPVRMLIAGRFLEVKGHEYAIRALGLLRAQGRRAELVLLGDGPLVDKMKALATTVGVADDVKFVGHVRHAEVAAHLRRADIYLHPSVRCAEGRTEGVPNAIMEAQATGLPVVATTSGGIGEVVLDGVTGYLVPERDAEALATRLAELIDDKALRRRMGAKGREHVEAEFNLPVQSRRLAAHIYHAIHAAELFDQRGWPKYRQPVATLDEFIARVPMADHNQLGERLASPYFRARRFLVGPIVKAYKHLVWFMVFRPYVRFLGREISKYLSEGVAARAGARGTWGAGVGAGATRLLAPGASSPAPVAQLMSTAQCGDCPHSPVGTLWPDVPCPMDRACLATLAREFASADEGRFSQPAGDVVVVNDATATPAANASNAAEVVHYQGSLQEGDDLATCVASLAKRVAPGGRLHLEVWPMPEGVDGGRLLGCGGAPFAQYFFRDDVRTEAVGAPTTSVRRFSIAELVAAGRAAGFALVQELAPAPAHDPCPVAVQARFAPLIMRIGKGRPELRASYRAVWQRVSAASAPT